MTRPRCICKTGPCPKAYCYRPEGYSVKDDNEIELHPEEMEALRLKDLKNMDQTDAAEKMGISQSSFQRILSTARKKVSCALFEGRIIKIKKK